MPSEIMVLGKDHKFPFSKGIVTRSIMSTGVNMAEAYTIAKELENHLKVKKEIEITRDHIRSYVYEALKTKYSKDCADRYLLWQSFKRSTEPLIFLIGGTTGTGKSTISASLARRLGVSHVIGTDSIREVLRMDLPAHKYPALHRSSFDAWKALDDIPEKFPDRVIKGFEEQLKLVNHGIDAVVKRSLVEGVSIVIEGIHIVPGFVEYIHSKNVLAYAIGVSDKDEHLMRFKARGLENNKRDASKYLQSLDEIRIIQNFIYSQAIKHDITIIDHKTINKTIDLIYDHIMERVRAYMV